MLYHPFKTTVLFLLLAASVQEISGQQPGEAAGIHGTVRLSDGGGQVHSATVSIVGLGRSALTDERGAYRFLDVPPGTYDLVSHMHELTSRIQKVEVAPGQAVEVDFELSISPIRYEVTVTSSGREETPFDAFQAVSVIDSITLGEQGAFGLGEVLGGESGVHKRSFGPGSSRPVVRGFDGDRVLVLHNGLATGTLSSQSGEHAEPVDSANLDRIEVVKGPATLLYGSNAIGGVVNMVTEHHLLHEHPHPGLRGQVTALGGSNGNQASGHVNAEYGHKNWLFWGSAARQTTGDYSSPLGRVANSQSRMTSGSLGFGWFAERPFFNLSYAFNQGRLGVPFAGEFHQHHGDQEETDPFDPDHEHEASALVDETFTWQNVRVNTGMKGMKSFIEEIKIAANFSRWIHRELENDETATSFDNRLINVRATFAQRPWNRLTGTSGFQLFHRDYASEGEEALSPPVKGNGFALFTLQEIDLPGARLQFGARIDRTAYDPSGMPHRAFTGLSGAAGIHVPLWENAAFVANFTRSHRAPAIEELYNNGPHIGNLTFEAGNPYLAREAADGLDLSLRHGSSRFESEANFYWYGIRDFVYLRLTGGTEHGLKVADFAQADARFVGGEAQLNIALHRQVWLESGLDAVDARLTRSGDPLPRIPPLRGTLGINARWRGLSFRPEIVMARHQNNIYPTETRTPGYAVLNVKASYTLARSGLMHLISFGLYNAGDRLYRNHLSFIKDLAPEMGRSARLTYSLRFF